VLRKNATATAVSGDSRMPANEDQQDQWRHGAEEIDRDDHGVADRARARERGEGEQKPADEAERDDDKAQQQRHLEALQDQRQRARHDVEIEKLMDQRVHQLLRHAKRVSR
jgi:hypothetical protein